MLTITEPPLRNELQTTTNTDNKHIHVYTLIKIT